VEDEDKKPDERLVKLFYKLRIYASAFSSTAYTCAWIMILNPHKRPGVLSAMFGGLFLFLAAKKTDETYNVVKEYRFFKKNNENQH
jgi:hypothetical protein